MDVLGMGDGRYALRVKILRDLRAKLRSGNMANRDEHAPASIEILRRSFEKMFAKHADGTTQNTALITETCNTATRVLRKVIHVLTKNRDRTSNPVYDLDYDMDETVFHSGRD